jgi:uncharacterized protein (UPF0548 family)
MVHDHHETVVPVPAGVSPDDSFETARERLFRYRMFPERLLLPRLASLDGRVAEGTVVAFRFRLPLVPLAFESAVRVVETWDRTEADARAAVFAVATLEGHVERGFETFEVRLERSSGRLTFAIDAWSRPAWWLARLGGPITRRFQLAASRAALRFVASSGSSTSGG